MPFTFSHPAIVLPLAKFDKKWFSLTGLVIGSVIPDFEYFIRMTIFSAYSHTLSGVFWFDFPLALILTFVFHNIIRNTLFRNLPNPLKYRCLPFMTFNWNRYFLNYWWVVCSSIFIGIFSHLFWDAFTHPGGFFVQLMPILHKGVTVLGRPMPIMKVIQHSSTIVGGLFILYTLLRLPKTRGVKIKSDIAYWFVWSFFVIGILASRFFTGHNLNRVSNFVVVICSAMIVAFIVTPLFFRRTRFLKQ